LLIGLSACGGAAQPTGLKTDDKPAIAAPDLPEEPDAPLPDVEVAPELPDEPEEHEKSEPTAPAGLELPPGTPFVRPEPIDHPLAGELSAVVRGFSREFFFPEFEDVYNMPFTSPTLSGNLFVMVWFQRYQQIREESGLADEEAFWEASKIHYTELAAAGRRFFGDDFNFPPGVEAFGIVPEAEYYVPMGRGGIPYVGYFLLDVSEGEGYYTTTFLPFAPNYSWDDGAIVDVGFLNPNSDQYANRMLWRGSFQFPDEETRMGTVHGGDVDFWDYLYIHLPQEELGVITVTFQRAVDGRIIAVSSRYH